ncbi:MAG TPA: protease pro-enzyme activation domain-containing protein [Desulfosporosinus sp.]|nr:protease pro-enzyme activation domain-containing protein [Desulfosporosinus sp.]
MRNFTQKGSIKMILHYLGNLGRKLFKMQKGSVLKEVCLALAMLLFLVNINVQPVLAGTAQNEAYVPLTTSNVTPLLSDSDVIKTRDIEPDKQLDITVALKLRNKDDLKRKIDKARAEGVLGRVMSDQDLEDGFLPDENAQTKVVDYLTSNGLKIIKTYQGHMAIQVSGTAEEIEKAFNVSLSYFSEDGNEFFANSTQPQLPEEIAGLVECVAGLNNLHFKPASSWQDAVTSMTANSTTSYTPQQIQKAYNLTTAYKNNINGQGVNLAIATYYSFKQSDITYFLNQFGISGTKSIQVIPVDGTPTYDASGSGETTLDIECALSSAPGAQLMVYDGADSLLSTGIDLFTKIVDDGKADVVSYSWGLEERYWDASQISAMNNLFAAGAAKGMTFLVASGDAGSSEISYPATDPYVTSVGGTTLNLDSSSGLISTEGGWSGSGGGSSTLFSQPTWQKAALKSSSGNRLFPDVSLNSNPKTGYSIYFGGNWYIYGGTSAAAPEWAAIFALVDQSRSNNGLDPIGLGNSALYSLTDQSVFHDITSGSNGAYKASAGYDMVTGLGSVDAWGLVKALSGLTDGAVPASVTDLSVSSSSATELDLTWSTVSGATSYKVYQSTSVTGNYILVGTSTTASYSDTNLSESTTYYYKVSAVNSNGEGPQSSAIKGITATKLTGVALNKISTVLDIGASETLIATVSPANATNKEVTWDSSDPSIAIIDSTGNVTGIKAGKSVITVTTVDGNKTAACSVEVSANVLPAQQDISLDKEWRITFSHPVDSSALQSNILLSRLDTATKAEVQVDITLVIDPDNSKVVIVKHATPFVAGASYKLLVNVGVKDVSGQSLSNSTVLSFMTQP